MQHQAGYKNKATDQPVEITLQKLHSFNVLRLTVLFINSFLQQNKMFTSLIRSLFL